MTATNPNVVYKLNDSADPLGPLGLMLRDAHPSINRGKMSCRVRISRESPDRAGDTVRARGAVLDEHRANPVVMVAHSKIVCCGMAEDRMGGYTVKTAGDGKGLEAETFFSQNTEIGEQAFRLVESKVFRGASIGFLPMEGYVVKSHHGGTDYQRWKLVEYSHLPLPEHPDCLVEAVHKGFGGKQLCAPLMDILKPLVPDRPEYVVSGWQPETKGRTHLQAGPMDAIAQYRSHKFYTCPHCGKEMKHDNIYNDEHGNTRHGDCRGHVVLKEPLHVPEAVNEPVGITHGLPYKSLGRVIAKRLRTLRRKAMQNYDDDRDDEFYPAPDGDGAAAEGPEAAAGAEANPHADHEAVVTEAVGNVLASIYDKFSSGQIDLKQALKLFKECLTHHGNVSSLGGEEDEDAEDGDLEGLEDEDTDHEDEPGFGEEDDEEEEDDGPDLEDKDRKKQRDVEKALVAIVHKQHAPMWRTIHTGLGYIANEPADLDSDATKAYARKLQRRMMRVEPIEKAIREGVMVTKAMASDEEINQFFSEPKPAPEPKIDDSEFNAFFADTPAG